MSGEHAWRDARTVAARWSGIALLAGAGFLAGCFAGGTDSGASSGSGGSGSYGSSAGGGPAQPLLVDVDTGGTLVTTAGNGIGVYVEYQSGGHWRVSWTCDTSLTNLPCNFVVDANVTTGTVATTGDSLEPQDSVSSPYPQEIEAVTTTTTGVDAIFFDATPGAPMTVTVSLNAPVSFFFVQDSLVNGGYTGTLTNPLMFQPSTP
jgi:hypothetical protein